MLFNTLEFAYLLLVSFCLYYLPAFRKVQLHILVLSSFLFYAWSYPALLLLLIASIIINATGSFAVAHNPKPAYQKAIAVVSVIINLIILGAFKYAGLIGYTFFNGNKELVDYLVAIPLPIGISFYTFQGISLIIDTFRQDGRIRLEKQIKKSFLSHLLNTSLFISLFPQLVAGPIVKAHNFYPQIKEKKFSQINWDFIFTHLVIGYFLKMVIADNLKDFTFEIAYPYFERFSSTYLIALLFAYSMQIFADFAGYSLIAIGISKLFGYDIPINFNFPYMARSFADFWKRWHISLSSFLKEYLYIPLGGNRKGEIRTYFNLFAVMAIGGLWHGAAWSYMVWGMAHGFFLVGERLLRKVGLYGNSTFYNSTKMAVVFSIVTMAWLLFKLPNFDHVILYFKAIKSNTGIYTDALPLLALTIYSLPVIFYHLTSKMLSKKSLQIKYHLKPAILGLLLLMIFLNSGSPQDFIYFQF